MQYATDGRASGHPDPKAIGRDLSYGDGFPDEGVSSTRTACCALSWCGPLAGFAEAFQGFVVNGELAFLLQAVFESGAEGVEGGTLLGLKELLLDLVLLFGQIFGQDGLMGDDFVNDPGAAELRRGADLAYRHAEGGLELTA